MGRTDSVGRSGLFYALICYIAWGMFPLYWRLLSGVPPQQILAHRIIWSAVFLGLLLRLRNDRTFFGYLRSGRILATLALTALLIGGNWFVYIYAVNHQHVVDASLGYYINPLMNVVLGTLLLHEKLNRLQWAAVALALAGVVSMAIMLGRVPAISLFLAFTFGMYGLLRKKANLQSMPGLMVETTILLLPALVYLWTALDQGHLQFGIGFAQATLLLLLSGPVTALPLLWFGIAATKVPLSTLGFAQYISPTLQLIIGIVVFRESFTAAYYVCFGLVWLALLLFSVSLARHNWAKPSHRPALED